MAQSILDIFNIDPNWLNHNWNDYSFDPSYAQYLIARYKDLIWLVLTMVSTLAVVYGIFLPQLNSLKQRKHEATLSLIDRWTSQNLPQAVSEYATQVRSEPVPLVYSEPKSKLYSFFHTVALLIREKKVDEDLIKKSQIGIGFVAFYNNLLIEQPDLPQKHTYYGRDFFSLYQRWKGLLKKHPQGLDLFFPTTVSSYTPSLDPTLLQQQQRIELP
jgi:hypothetical protein